MKQIIDLRVYHRLTALTRPQRDLLPKLEILAPEPVITLQATAPMSAQVKRPDVQGRNGTSPGGGTVMCNREPPWRPA